jgi:hypothetical protein
MEIEEVKSYVFTAKLGTLDLARLDRLCLLTGRPRANLVRFMLYRAATDPRAAEILARAELPEVKAGEAKS